MTSTLAPIRFSVIGFGFIGQRHAEIIKGHPECTLVGICDIKAEKKAVAEAYGVPFFESAEELLEQVPEAEVICICTPNGSHTDLAMLALRQRRHLVIEKPMGLSKANCEAVLVKALQLSKQVFIVMQNRYSPTSIWLKDMVTAGHLGKIFSVQVNCFWNRDDRYYGSSDWRGSRKMDGGPLFTQFSHFIDILFWLFGEPEDFSCRFKNYNHQHNTEFEDTGHVLFRFPSGIIGSLNYSTSVWDKNFESSITIFGDKGTIKVGGQYMERIEYCHVEGYEAPELPPANPPNDYGPYKGSAANHHYIFENVVSTLRGKTTATTNGFEGMKVVEVIEEIYSQRLLY